VPTLSSNDKGLVPTTRTSTGVLRLAVDCALFLPKANTLTQTKAKTQVLSGRKGNIFLITEGFHATKKLDLSFLELLLWGADNGVSHNKGFAMVEIEISDRARKYGYIFWPRKQDKEMSNLLGRRDAVSVVFLNAEHGRKNIDWKHRRISIGYRWTQSLSASKTTFLLELSKANKLEIQCR